MTGTGAGPGWRENVSIYCEHRLSLLTSRFTLRHTQGPFWDQSPRPRRFTSATIRQSRCISSSSCCVYHAQCNPRYAKAGREGPPMLKPTDKPCIHIWISCQCWQTKPWTKNLSLCVISHLNIWSYHSYIQVILDVTCNPDKFLNQRLLVEHFYRIYILLHRHTGVGSPLRISLEQRRKVSNKER